MFNKGDLFFLNADGVTLFRALEGVNGIIISDRYLLYDHTPEGGGECIEYYAYDILIKNILFKEIPEKFLLRVIKSEKNLK